jgi:RNA polymerase sigma-70 factor, ECF subfamily
VLEGAAASSPKAESRKQRFRHLIDRYTADVTRTLRSYGVQAADLDDGLQLVLMVAARRIDDLEPASERAFLINTAYNIAARIRRTRFRRREAGQEVSCDAPSALANPELQMAQIQALALTRTILATLPEELRSVFVLAELDELSTQEIAATLHLPRGTVASRLRRAREAFQEHVRRLAPHPGSAEVCLVPLSGRMRAASPNK